MTSKRRSPTACSSPPAPSASPPVPLSALEVRGVDPGWLRQGAGVENEEERIEQEQVPRAAGVDHAGPGQDRQHLGGAGQGVGRLDAGTLDHAHQARAVGRPDRGGGRHRQDGALDRAHHRTSGEVGGMGDGPDERVGVDAVGPRACHALAHTPQKLRQDHAGVPPRSHQRTVADGLAHLGQAGPGLDTVQLADHGFEGQRHVGAGVPVGHRVDVEAVDVTLMQPEGVPVPPHHGAQFVGAQRRRGGHGRGC